MPFFKKGIEIRAIIVLFYLFYGRLLSARLDQTKNREFDWVFRGAHTVLKYVRRCDRARKRYALMKDLPELG